MDQSTVAISIVALVAAAPAFVVYLLMAREVALYKAQAQAARALAESQFADLRRIRVALQSLVPGPAGAPLAPLAPEPEPAPGPPTPAAQAAELQALQALFTKPLTPPRPPSPFSAMMTSGDHRRRTP